jgi:GNAT superfamily N-acetyltransferase
MHIRPLHEDDIPAIARLMWSLSEEFIVNDSAPEAAAAFKRENDEDGVRGFLRAGMRYHVAEADGAIAGFIAVRENKHLFHLFVDKAWHRRGVGRRLWDVARQAALAAGNPGLFTVNSSNGAVAVYEAFGFVRTDIMQQKNGLYFNPMQLDGRHCD